MSYFFKVYRKIHTPTNEIDELIVLTDEGKQAIRTFNLERSLLQIDDDLFIGECKNYSTSLGVTYIGKFYSLMIAMDMHFGIVFTQEGLTGNSSEYHYAYGLTKVLRLMEEYRNHQNLYIIDFTLEDYVAKGRNFFQLN